MSKGGDVKYYSRQILKLNELLHKEEEKEKKRKMKNDNNMSEYVDYLESLVTQGLDINKKYMSIFQKEARFMGGNWYSWGEFESKNLRVLFLKGSLSRLGIFFKDEY